MMEILSSFQARSFMVNCPKVPTPTSTRAVRWILQVMLSEPRHHILWILGIPAVNAWDKVNIFGTPATRIISLADVPHWSAPDHVLGEATSVGISVTRSELDYSYKTDFQNWRENQDFGRQNISMS